jgi:hypothetical protein
MTTLRTALLTLALLASLAGSVLGATSALAASTNNPQYQECNKVAAGTGKFTDAACTKEGVGNFEEKLLGAEGKEFSAEASSAQTFADGTAKLTVSCSALKVAKGAKLIGSTAPAPGTSEETLEYEKCEVVGKAACEINKGKAGSAKFTSNPLKTTLVFATKAAAEKEESDTLTLIEPKTGTAFSKFELSGECPVTGSFTLEGSILAENVEGSTNSPKHTLNLPAEAITAYFSNSSGKTTEGLIGFKGGGVKVVPGGRGVLNLFEEDSWKILNS